MDWPGPGTWQQWIGAAGAAALAWLGRRQLRPSSWLRRRLALERTVAIQDQTIHDLEDRLERRNVEVERLALALDRLAHAAGLVRAAVESDPPPLSGPRSHERLSTPSTSPTGSRPSRGGSRATDSPSPGRRERDTDD